MTDTATARVTVRRGDLTRGLTTVSHGRGHGTYGALADGVLLRADGLIATTSGSSWMSTRIHTDDDSDGCVLVSYRQLTRILRSDLIPRHPDTVVSVWQRDDCAWVPIPGSGNASFPAWLVDTVPHPPATPPTVATVDATGFAAAAARVTRIQTTPELALGTARGQTHLIIDGDRVTLATTDGYVAAVHPLPAERAGSGGRIVALIPTRLLARTLHQLTKRAGPGARVKIGASPGLTSLTCGDVTVVSRVTTAPPIPIDRVIPTTWTITATVDRVRVTEIVDSIVAAAPGSVDGWSALRLGIEPDRVRLTLVTVDGDLPDVTVLADVDHAEASHVWWLMPRLLATALRVLTGDTVTIHGSDHRKPLLLTGGDAARAAIMPTKPPRYHPDTTVED